MDESSTTAVNRRIIYAYKLGKISVFGYNILSSLLFDDLIVLVSNMYTTLITQL